MAKTYDLKDSEILRFLRFSVTESAAATFTQTSIDTNLSVDRGVIWLIHFIEMGLDPEYIDDPAQNATETFKIQVTRESKTAILSYNDADLIEMGIASKDRVATIGTEAGPSIQYAISPHMFKYQPAIPYAAGTIYVGVQSTSSAAKTGVGRIGYTIRHVSDKFFYRVASALI